MALPKSEFDTPWKKILDVYFEDFMAYCWPVHYLDIDWSKGYKLLDKELSKLSKTAKVTNRVVDKLIEVCLKAGSQAYVLVHLEVQGQKDNDFAERMFTYRYRLRDVHQKPIASLAVLIDNNMEWRPNFYREALWDSSIEMRFPIIKLIDYKECVQELERSSNRFAEVILAQLVALEKEDYQIKLKSKIGLVRRLYKRGWKKEDIHILFTFLEWVVSLPAGLEKKFRQAVIQIEEELEVEYMNSFERQGMEKGMQQGVQQGIQQGIQQGMQQGIQKGESAVLMRQLKYKFKTIPDNYRQKVETADSETLLIWSERILDSHSLEEVFKV